MAQDNVGFELMKLLHVLKREYERRDKVMIQKVFGDTHTLTSADLMFIGFIAGEDAGDKVIYQKDIEEFFSLTAPTVSCKLRTLEKNEMITRVYCKEDTRFKRVMLTEKGKIVATKMKAERDRASDEILEVLTKEECERMIAIARKLVNTFI